MHPLCVACSGNSPPSLRGASGPIRCCPHCWEQCCVCNEPTHCHSPNATAPSLHPFWAISFISHDTWHFHKFSEQDSRTQPYPTSSTGLDSSDSTSAELRRNRTQPRTGKASLAMTEACSKAIVITYNNSSSSSDHHGSSISTICCYCN